MKKTQLTTQTTQQLTVNGWFQLVYQMDDVNISCIDI